MLDIVVNVRKKHKAFKNWLRTLSIGPILATKAYIDTERSDAFDDNFVDVDFVARNPRNTVRIGFEGGQSPLQKRLPKLRGFQNPFRVEYQAINLDVIADFVEATGSNDITPDALFDKSLIGKGNLVKVLGRGELTTAVNVKAHAFSASAEAAITDAGGTVEKLDLPFSVRPPSSGNQHMNR